MKKADIAHSTWLLCLFLVLLWSGIFIWQTSFVALDGSRRFCLFDDSLITLRYSWNLAHGEGLVWNPGERVEGFTSPLWALLLSLPALVLSKSQLVPFVQFLGVGLLLGMGYFSSRIAEVLFKRDHGNSRPGSAPPKGELGHTRVSPQDSGDRPYPGTVSQIAFLLPTLYYPISFLTLAGMETGLLTLLVLASLDRVLRRPYSGGPDLPLAVLLGLSFLARPDALLFCGGVLLFRAWQALRGRSGWAGLGWEAVVFGAFAAGVQDFRWLYYGTLVPNTYLVKVAGIPLSFRLPNGVFYLLPLLPPLLFPLVLAAWGNIRTRLAEGWLVISLVLVFIAYTVWVGGDFLPFPRFIAPLVPPLLLLATGMAMGNVPIKTGEGPALGTVPVPRGGLSPVWTFSRFLRKVPPAAILLLITLLAAAPFLPDLVFSRPIYTMDYNRRNTEAAIVLQKVLRPTAKVAVTWAGAIPYWTDLRGVDLLGKCDPVIARLRPAFRITRKPWGMWYTPGHNRFDLAHSVLRLQPDFVQSFLYRSDQESALNNKMNTSYRWMSFPGVNIFNGLYLLGGLFPWIGGPWNGWSFPVNFPSDTLPPGKD